MKGIWFRNLFILSLLGKITVRDAVSFSLARMRRKPISINFNGIQFEDVDHIFWSLLADVYINRVYTPNGFDICKNDIVIDIGAHRGSFTSFAATLTRSGVYAYEPYTESFTKLKKLIADNQLTNVHAYSTAIGAKTGNSPLFLSASSSRHNLDGHEIGTTIILKDSIDVNVLALDDCLENLDTVDLLKIDCEGSEVDILLNASDKTMSKIMKITAEIHDPIDSDRIKNLCKFLNRFFPHIKLIQQDNPQYGYLYARK